MLVVLGKGGVGARHLLCGWWQQSLSVALRWLLVALRAGVVAVCCPRPDVWCSLPPMSMLHAFSGSLNTQHCPETQCCKFVWSHEAGGQLPLFEPNHSFAARRRLSVVVVLALAIVSVQGNGAPANKAPAGPVQVTKVCVVDTFHSFCVLPSSCRHMLVWLLVAVWGVSR